MPKHAITIYAPTASGKTSLAIALAQKFNATIINTDSRQFFKHMPLLTAVPSKSEQSQAEHLLYEILEPTTIFSAGDFLNMARKTAMEVTNAGKTPIFVGGSGLYMDVLLHGLSPIPDIPQALVEALNSKLETLGTETMYQKLQQVDPAWAKKFPPTDKQRTVRGLAVHEFTGKPLSEWLKQPKAGALEYNFYNLAIARPREERIERINQRFEIMWNDGLLDEIKALKNMGFAPNLPALRSLGLTEMYAYLDGKMDFLEAKEKFLIKHRQYAKRQMTWLKNTHPASSVWETPDAQKIGTEIKNFFAYNKANC